MPSPGRALSTSRPAGPRCRCLLTATPAPRDTHVPSPLLRVALQRRLRLPVWDCDSACGLCGEVLDRWGDHALCCGGGGDRVLRHSAVRNVVCSAVAEFTSVFSRTGETPASCARPLRAAHARIPVTPSAFALPLLVGAALRTSGSPRELRVSLSPWISRSPPSFAPPSSLRPSPPRWQASFDEVESRKHSFQDTASQVAALGATFRPLVVEHAD